MLLRISSRRSIKQKRIGSAEVIKQQQPDIIVSDVMMPQMNGYQLCKEIKENLNISHIPVILLTARADSESQMLGYKLGADAYLPKPFEMEMLLSVIQNQMRNREYIKSRYRGNQFILSPQEATFSNADEQFMIKLNEMIRSESVSTRSGRKIPDCSNGYEPDILI